MSFSEEMAAAKEQVLETTNELKQAAALELFSSVILATPVDTGRARGNWQCSTDRPNLTTTDKQDKSGRETIRNMINKVNSSELESSLYLTNNLPYAVPLENGSSKQAPQGMVRKNLARIKALLRANK